MGGQWYAAAMNALKMELFELIERLLIDDLKRRASPPRPYAGGVREPGCRMHIESGIILALGEH